MTSGFSSPNRFPIATLAKAWRMRHTHRLATVATMTRRFMTIPFRGSVLQLTFLVLALVITADADKTPADEFRVTVTIDRGQDLGQCFGSLFEATTNDDSLVVGAGFQNAYNTRYRADRHTVQFFLRPATGTRELQVEKLPRPNDNLTGTYLHSRDGLVYSTYGDRKRWNSETHSWQSAALPDGGTGETMRVADGLLDIGGSDVKYNGEIILSPPDLGSYQLFYYANGYLCFYHVNRGDGPYRPWTSDEDGFSRLYACPWKPTDGAIDLSKAITFRTPVVGETTFAWGQLGDQIVTGSNIGGFYAFDNGSWRMILDPPLNKSFQLYSSVMVHDRLLMGQYPTGRLFEYDGKDLTELSDSPPAMKGVRRNAREAQTAAIYGGEIFVGVWPWAELWRHHPDTGQWVLQQRMFDHPAASDETTHPYDVENQDNSPRNFWGQRVTSLIPQGAELLISTSSKGVSPWDAKSFPFLAPDKWKSYGAVYRLTMPGHLSAPTKWTTGSTTLEFIIRDREMSIRQDGVLMGTSRLTGSLAAQIGKARSLKTVRWGSGIYGPHQCVSLEGKVSNP